MKKTILSVAILLMTIFNPAFSKTVDNTTDDKNKSGITALIIDANVKVVLVNGGDKEVFSEGDEFFTQQVQIKKKGNTVIISSKHNRDLKSRGVIYVPAIALGFIRINHDAAVQSLNTLRVPNIDVIVNGACEVSIVTTGEVNLIETDAYTFVQTVKKLRMPAAVAFKD